MLMTVTLVLALVVVTYSHLISYNPNDTSRFVLDSH